MSDYDAQVAHARVASVKITTGPAWREVHGDLSPRVAECFDALNNAWDRLTDCLVRQRKERDALISRLLNELAEAKKT